MQLHAPAWLYFILHCPTASSSTCCSCVIDDHLPQSFWERDGLWFNIKLLASRLLTTLSLTHPWVQTSYNGSISSNFDCTRLFIEAEHLRGPEHLRACGNIPGGTFFAPEHSLWHRQDRRSYGVYVSTHTYASRSVFSAILLIASRIKTRISESNEFCRPTVYYRKSRIFRIQNISCDKLKFLR